MIVAKSLSKNYGNRKAISDVSFHIKKGEILGFLGPNGAGKTTTMKILTGCLAPSQGEVLIGGILLSEQPILAKKKIGYLPEQPPVYTDMFVEDYLKYVAHLKQCDRLKINSLVGSAMEKSGVTSVKKRLIQNLSKGFKQRVGLAQALVSDPEVLILDEPTVGLDPKQVVEIRKLLSQLKGQHTIILSTHILPEVQISCERVIIINEGKIVTENSLEGLSEAMSAKRQLILRVNRVSDSLINKLQSIAGVVSAKQKNSVVELNVSADKSVNEKVAEVVVFEKSGLLEMKEVGFNLEDVFIKLTNT